MEFTCIREEQRVPLCYFLDGPEQELPIAPEIAQVKLILDIAGSCQGIDIPIENCHYSNHEITINKLHEVLPIKSEIIDNIAVLEVTLNNSRIYKKAVYFKILKEEKESVTDSDILIAFH
ncbi:hypothetical protein OJ253_3382 [Cryptosporidium canis]|uniref:Uncharacterized protein n=1 Tax=Cryptosporidium canis TaxID=195482 RepID=A0A9D5DIT4_9CRYT|nr:hypothetical protein OJ253_3382 [Cryptosporidium canis]